jgi:hypothetical protein
MRSTERLLASLLVLGLGGAAMAGGPLIVDPTTRKAWAYGPGTVPVYFDLGDFGVVYDWNNYPATVTFDNAAGRALVEKGYRDWSGVPTTSLRAQVQGDFARRGLPDITGANADLVIGAFNGGGVDVIFDADGTVMQDFFGVGSNVLGISTPEFGDDQGHITESWTVLNGQAVQANDVGVAAYQGVATHEFGHSLGLAHTQTNGAVYFYGPYLGERPGPQSCATLPYRSDVASGDVETMYPYADPTPGTGTGEAQAFIHTSDDLAAISDLYPGPGWPQAAGTISGRVLDVDGKTPLTGVNVIARNLADPFTDATSTLSGAWTQGQFGPDGTFTLHGLKPGARYALYVDAVVAGGFPTQPLWFLPGPERFWPGAGSTSADPCAAGIITARAGKTVQADLRFQRKAGAPVVFSLGYASGATGISGDGTTVVGNFGRGGPVFKWTEKTGLQSLFVASTGEFTSISRNGKYLSSNLLDGNETSLGAHRYDEKEGWQPVAPTGSCGTDTTSNYGVADDGSVYGLTFNTCLDFKPFRWSPGSGTRVYRTAGHQADGTPANGRPNQISADGRVLGGWEEDDTGSRVAVVWVDGRPTALKDAQGNPLSEVSAVSADGSLVAGTTFDFAGDGYRKQVGRRGGLELVAPVSPDAAPLSPYALNRDGSVMAGMSGNPWFSWSPGPFLWTRQLGPVNLDEFLRRQGTAFEQYTTLWTPMVMSDDGTVIAGWGLGAQYFAGWVLKMKQVFVCHLDREERGPGHTRLVKFPQDFDDHLAHGDPPGPCPDR